MPMISWASDEIAPVSPEPNGSGGRRLNPHVVYQTLDWCQLAPGQRPGQQFFTRAWDVPTPEIRLMGLAENAGCIRHTGGGKQPNGNQSKFHDLPLRHFTNCADGAEGASLMG